MNKSKATVWIYKLDGHAQCGQGREIGLAEMAQELSDLGIQVLASEKRMLNRLIPHTCGLPVGSVNAYEIPRADWELLDASITSGHGFELWSTRIDEENLPDDDL